MSNTFIHEILQNCVLLLHQVMKMEKLDGGRLQMVIMGFVATMLSPLLAVIYVLHGAFKLVSMILPLLSICLMLIIGLPVLTLVRWTYAIYLFIYNVLIHFYLSTSDGVKSATKVGDEVFQKREN